MVYSNKLIYIKNIYNFKIFKKNIKFKKYNKGFSKYIINRKKYFLKKKRTNFFFYYFIVNNWTLYFNRLRRYIKYYQMLCILNKLYSIPSIEFFSKNNLLGVPFNSARVPVKNLLNKFFIKKFYNQIHGTKTLILINDSTEASKKLIQNTIQIDKLFYVSTNYSKLHKFNNIDSILLSTLNLNIQILTAIRKILILLVIMKF